MTKAPPATSDVLEARWGDNFHLHLVVMRFPLPYSTGLVSVETSQWEQR